MPTKLLQAPRALHRRHRFHRRDKRSRQTQRQHQAGQFPFKRFEPVDEKRATETEYGQHRKRDDHLLGAVMQYGFEEVTVPADEIPGDRIVKQFGQVHVQVGQFE
ncbi:hypothetical protein D3C86_1822140 [compost metagenome]